MCQCTGRGLGNKSKKKVNSSPDSSVSHEGNDGQCLNLVSFSTSNLECSCTDSPGQDAICRTLVHRGYLHNNVGTHLKLSILRQIGVNEIAQASKANHAQCGDRTHDPRVLRPTP